MSITRVDYSHDHTSIYYLNRRKICSLYFLLYYLIYIYIYIIFLLYLYLYFFILLFIFVILIFVKDHTAQLC